MDIHEKYEEAEATIDNLNEDIYELEQKVRQLENESHLFRNANMKLKERIKELEERERKLDALEAGGVDNWEGYDFSMEGFWEEEEDL